MLSFGCAFAAQQSAPNACPELDSPRPAKRPRVPRDRTPINDELADFIADFIKDLSFKMGGSVLHSFGVRDAFLLMVQKLKGPESPEEEALRTTIEWAATDGNNRFLSKLVRKRMLDGWRILRDSVRLDRTGKPLEITDAEIVADAFTEILKGEAIRPAPIRRRQRSRGLGGGSGKDAAVINTSIATQISFDPEIENQFAKQLVDLKKSFTGIVIAPGFHRPQSTTILYAKDEADSEPKGYLANVVWDKDQPNSVVVTKMVPLTSWHAPIVVPFWQSVADSQGLKEKKAILKTALAVRPEWEEFVKISASVMAKVKYMRGIELSEIEDWFRQYVLKRVTNLHENRTEYTFANRTQPRLFLQIRTVDRGGSIFVTDVILIQKD
jgi:hypothetical protein